MSNLSSLVTKLKNVPHLIQEGEALEAQVEASAPALEAAASTLQTLSAHPTIGGAIAAEPELATEVPAAIAAVNDVLAFFKGL